MVVQNFSNLELSQLGRRFTSGISWPQVSETIRKKTSLEGGEARDERTERCAYYAKRTCGFRLVCVRVRELLSSTIARPIVEILCLVRLRLLLKPNSECNRVKGNA